MSHYVGLDVSLTGTGCVTLSHDGEHRADTVGDSNPAMRVEQRIARYDRIIEQIINCLPPTTEIACLCIEGYSMASKGRGILDRAELGGILRHTLIDDWGLTPVEVAPNTLKLFATGKGNASKVEVAVAVSRRYDVVLANDNEYEAYALARMAACLAGAEAPQTAFQSRALEALCDE